MLFHRRISATYHHTELSLFADKSPNSIKNKLFMNFSAFILGNAMRVCVCQEDKE